MLTLPHVIKIFIATQAADMRKSFSGLPALVHCTLQKDPFCGHLFVSLNRRCDQVRVLFWDRSGFCVLTKRLERVCFRLPEVQEGATHAAMEAAGLTLILEGIHLRRASKKKRWEPSQVDTKASRLLLHDPRCDILVTWRCHNQLLS